MDTTRRDDFLRHFAAFTDAVQEFAGGPETDDPYANAREFEFTKTYNGNLTKDYRDQQKIRWLDWITDNQPRTKETYSGRPGVFLMAGGLNILSGGKAHKAYRRIQREGYERAADRAEALRESAGWTGRHFLTSPSGKQRGPNGQYFGVFTKPSDSL